MNYSKLMEGWRSFLNEKDEFEISDDEMRKALITRTSKKEDDPAEEDDSEETDEDTFEEGGEETDEDTAVSNDDAEDI